MKITINILFLIAILGTCASLISCEKETIVGNRSDDNDRTPTDTASNDFWLTADVKKYTGTNIFLDSVLVNGNVYQDPEWEFLKHDTTIKEYWVKIINDSLYIGRKDSIIPNESLVSTMHVFNIAAVDANGWFKSNNGSCYKFEGDTMYHEYLYTYNSRYDNKTHKIIYHYKGIQN